jgi:hypothetical protein
VVGMPQNSQVEGQVHPTKVERKGKRDTSDWIIVPWHDSGEVSLEGLEEELENLQGQQVPFFQFYPPLSFGATLVCSIYIVRVPLLYSLLVDPGIVKGDFQQKDFILCWK